MSQGAPMVDPRTNDIISNPTQQLGSGSSNSGPTATGGRNTPLGKWAVSAIGKA